MTENPQKKEPLSQDPLLDLAEPEQEDLNPANENPFLEKTKEKLRTLFEQEFAEIDIAPAPPQGGPMKVYSEDSQELVQRDPASQAAREKFSQMRDLAGSGLSFGRIYEAGRASAFYKQAKFMENFTDDYAETVPLNLYFPDYQKLGFAQLRTYFTWRGKLRQGVLKEVSSSYLYLYIYELLNNIGVKDASDGMEKLVAFWEHFRRQDPGLDRYLPRWVKDYYICNEFSCSFAELVQAHPFLESYFPKRKQMEYYDRYMSLSRYRFEKSRFYSEEREKALRACFAYVTEGLIRWTEEAGLCFEDLLYYGPKGQPWTPFPKAIYYSPPNLRTASRTVKISEDEIYWLEKGRWYSSENRVHKENGRKIVEYLIRRAEQFVRKREKYSYQLGDGANKLSEEEMAPIPGGRAGFLAQVDKLLKAYYQSLQRIPVTVHPERLAQIRENALLTQEKLLAPLEGEEPELPVAQPLRPELPELPPSFVPDPLPLKEISPAGMDRWTVFAESLTIEERELLQMVLQGAPLLALEALVKSQGEMLEVAVDRLNEKALEAVEDTILELTEEARVFEDYRTELERVILVETE